MILCTVFQRLFFVISGKGKIYFHAMYSSKEKFWRYFDSADYILSWECILEKARKERGRVSSSSNESELVRGSKPMKIKCTIKYFS